MSEFKAKACFERKTIFDTNILIYNIVGNYIAMFYEIPHLADVSDFILTPKYPRYYGEVSDTL